LFTGVFALKNAVQFAATAFVVAELPPAAPAGDEGVGDGAGVDGPEPPQAARPAPSAHVASTAQGNFQRVLISTILQLP
jgi:hypothetical protein